MTESTIVLLTHEQNSTTHSQTYIYSYSILIRTHKSFTKVGFTGSIEQQDMFQTAIGRRIRSNDKNNPLQELNYTTGTTQNEMSTTSSTTHKITYPIHHGIIDDWDTMEHLWQTYLYDKLRCNPQDHYVLLTEPLFHQMMAKHQNILNRRLLEIL